MDKIPPGLDTGNRASRIVRFLIGERHQLADCRLQISRQFLDRIWLAIGNLRILFQGDLGSTIGSPRDQNRYDTVTW